MARHSEQFKSMRCFFITPLKKRDSSERKVANTLQTEIIDPVLRKLGMPRAKRADLDAHGKVIRDVLIDDLIEFDLVIADLSGGNPNVFYELGIRHATDKPCIHLKREDEAVAFDVSGIMWTDYKLEENLEFTTSAAEQARNELEKVIRKLCDSSAFPQKLLGEIIPLRRPAKGAIDPSERFADRTRAHHELIHAGRDLCLKCMGPNPRRFVVKPKRTLRNTEPPPIKALLEFKTELHEMLGWVVNMFELIVPPGVKLWAAIRDRRVGGNYYTFLRAGQHKKDRKNTSKPLHKTAPVVAELKRSTEKDLKCVIITGPGTKHWKSLPNDNLGENKSVLMGAICAKSQGLGSSAGKISMDKLMMLLTVNSSIPDVFSEEHVPLMQCCNDVFSMVINAMLRSKANDANFED